MTGPPAGRRCAIYTRVSSDGGLEQEFNSLHAQREAAEAYIKSQAHEGWRLRRERYDDGGFSGGSMDRPALQRLLADVTDGRIDIVVVYKVDRLTRALADFAKLVELFDRHSVSFVSVTQSFNTTSSMGRLTLNVLLSFAQFEREVTGERIRDKIAASKKKGIWMGGTVPLGYRVVDRKLLIDEVEAATVRSIYARYLALGSLPALQAELRENGIRTRKRERTSGTTIGGMPLTNGPLSHMLRNRVYLGEINHKDKSYPGDHPPLIDPAVFDAVQAQLAANAIQRKNGTGKSGAPLLGRIFDDRGNPMSPSHAVKGNIRYHYYVSTALVQGRKSEAGTVARLSARAIESAVLLALEQHGAVADDDVDISLADMSARLDLRVDVQDRALRISWSRASKGKAHRFSQTALEQPAATASSIATTDTDGCSDTERHAVTIPFAIQAQKRHREILLPDLDNEGIRPIRQKEQQSLVRSIAQARLWLREIMAGTTIATIASREEKSDRAIRMTLNLAFLDPKLVKAAMHGTLPRGISARRLVDAPSTWTAQWHAFGLQRPN